jgi:tetratricopeptide (TPR) repeat protein
MKRTCLFAVASISVAFLAWQPARSSGWGEELTAMIDSANVLLVRGRCEEAIPILERATARYPRIGAPHQMLADCYLRTGRAREAAALLEQCLEEDPGREVYIQRLGHAYLDLARKEKAIEVWRGLLKADERSASAYGIVARIERDAGLYDEAIATFREGSKIEGCEQAFLQEVIRLQRTIGRDEDAFRETLVLAGEMPVAPDDELKGLFAIFRESKKQERLVAIVDSMCGARNDKKGLYRMIRAAFLVEASRYDDARKLLFAKEAVPLGEDVLHTIVAFMCRKTDREGDGDFAALAADLMQQYLDRFDESIMAPDVMLMMAESKREAARNAAPGERERLLDEALAAAGGVRLHHLNALNLERACLFKAQVLFEDLHRDEDALRELGGIVPPSQGGATAAEELRVRILLAMPDRREAARQFERLASNADTSRAILGRYALGRLAFLDGRFEESMKTLSELAEKHSSSKWANDALDLAMEIKGAAREGGESLALYRSAVLARDRGEHPSAIDSLGALERRFPQSSLAPRAIFMKACLEAEAGEGGSGADSARADFERLAESYPLHDLAPRALEELAALSERENPAEAAERYGLIMERYPDYPFMERVRERYMAIGASMSEKEPGAASKQAPTEPAKNEPARSPKKGSQ